MQVSYKKVNAKQQTSKGCSSGKGLDTPTKGLPFAERPHTPQVPNYEMQIIKLV